METDALDSPWLELSSLIVANDVNAIRRFLARLDPSDMALTISRLDPDDQSQLFTLLGPREAADLIATVPEAQAADIVEQLPADRAAAILDLVRSDAQADLLGEMATAEAEAILERMSPEEATDARQLLAYPEDTVGGIMITEFLAYPRDWALRDIVTDLEKNRESYADYSVQYLYVVDAAGRLDGVLRIRDLIFSTAGSALSDLMIKEPLAIAASAHLDEVQQLFEQHSLLAVPVIDDARRLVGVVRRSAVEEAAGDRVARQFLGVSGIVGGEEFRTMPLLGRSGRRLSWLSINIVLNILAASVIALYTDTLAAVIALAVFLPMISDMSGCSGNQAVAVSMRELTLGLVRPRETLRVISKEATVGILNGIVLGVLLGAVAYFWKGNPYLGIVVGGSLAVNTLLAVCLGGSLPLILKRIGLDPALVSGPVLTTVTDMCGFFLVLNFASMLLSRLT